MAPIPTFSEETSGLILAARRIQADLIDVQVPRLRSCEGPLSLQQNLAAELREDIGTFEQQIAELDLCIDDQPGVKSQAALRDVVAEFKNSLSRLKRDARAALLFSKRTIDSHTKSRRDELFASSTVTEKANVNEKITDDALMKANDNVTEALRRTIAAMQGELERSVLTAQMLDSSTASLRSTSTTHDTLTHVMDTSKQLITALEKSDWIDRVLIISAFIFFVLVVLLVVKQRVLDRGLRIAFWWTRFLPDFSEDAQLLAREKAEAVAVVVESATGTLAIVLGTTSSMVPLSSPEPPREKRPAAEGHVGSLESTYSKVMSTSSLLPDLEPSSTVPVEGGRTLVDEL